MYLAQMCINPSIPCISPIQKKSSLFLNFTPYFHDYKKLLLSFEFYPLFSRAGGKLLFWKNPSKGCALTLAVEMPPCSTFFRRFWKCVTVSSTLFFKSVNRSSALPLSSADTCRRKYHVSSLKVFKVSMKEFEMMVCFCSTVWRHHSEFFLKYCTLVVVVRLEHSQFHLQSRQPFHCIGTRL